MKPLSLVALFGLALAFFVWDARAEVAVDADSNGSARGLVILGKTDGGSGGAGEPWPTIRQGVPPEWILDPGPEDPEHPHGSPVFAWDPVRQRLEVIWARWDGHDYELVCAHWEEGRWSEIVPLTDNEVDDLDPMLAYRGDGSSRLVYWSEGLIYFMDRPDGGEWSVTEVVSVGHRPSVGNEVEIRIAYQRPAELDLTDVMVAVRQQSWDPQRVAQTNFLGLKNNGNIDVRIESQNGQTWVVWEAGPQSLGWSKLLPNGVWSPVRYEPIQGADDEERGRARVRVQVLR